MGIIDRFVGRVVSEVVNNLPKQEATTKINLNDRILFQLFPDTFGTGGKKLNLDNAYKTIAVLHSCIRIRAKNIAQCPLKLYTYRGDTEITSGYWFDMLEDPNNFENYRNWMEGISTFINFKGGAFLEKVGEMRIGGISAPLMLDLLPSMRIKPHITDNGEFLGWDYDQGWKSKPRFIPKDKMVHFHLFNPYSRVEDLGPIEALKMTLETEWYSMRYNNRFFEGDAVPNMVYSVPSGASQRDVDALKQKIRAEREGVDRTHTSQVLTGGVEAKLLALTQRDMEFLEQRKFTREEVCMVTGVTKNELSLYEDVNYATALSQKKQFWEDQLIPEMKLIEETFNHQLYYPFGLYCKFDVSKVPALGKNLTEIIQNFAALMSTHKVSRKEAAEITGLELPKREGDDEITEPFNPFAEPGKDDDEPEDPKEEEDGEGEKHLLPTSTMVEAIRGAKWASLRKGVVHIEAKAAAAIRKYFFDCGKKLLKLMSKALDLSDGAITKARNYWTGEATPGGGPDNLVLRTFIAPEDIEDIFNDEKLKDAIEKYLEQALMVGGEQVFSGFDFSSPDILKALKDRLELITTSNETARKRVLNTINDVLVRRVEEGLGEEQAQKLLLDELKEDVKHLKSNARTIARTQTNGAYSDGRYYGAQESHPLGWYWLSSRDGDKVRETHRDLDGQTIPNGGVWVTLRGNSLSRPLDPAAPPGETINCRCIAQPIYDQEQMR